MQLVDALLGDYPPRPPRDIPIIVSVLYYSATILAGRLLRHAVRTWAPQRWQPYLLDAVTTFQVLGCSLENGQVRKYYGHGAYVLVMFTQGMWYSHTLAGSKANPCAHLISYMQDSLTLPQFLLRVASQLTGGLLSYRYARLFWSLGLHDGHMERYHLMYCVSDMAVASPLALTIEFSATLLESTLSLLTFSSFLTWEYATKCLLSCVMVSSGLHLTGMYLNPINASNQTFGCRGSSVAEHLLVYWLGPLTASALAAWIQRHVNGIKIDTFSTQQPPTSKASTSKLAAAPDDKMYVNNGALKNGGRYMNGMHGVVKNGGNNAPVAHTEANIVSINRVKLPKNKTGVEKMKLRKRGQKM